MATYVLPQVLVFQDFAIAPSVVANPMRAHISGGHAYLTRYEVEDEREFGRLGIYDRHVNTPYLWPNRPAGGVVDDSFTKLWVQNALLHYFSDPIGAKSDIHRVSGYLTRIRSSFVNFKTNGLFARYNPEISGGGFYDRDVQPGDAIRVRYQVPGSDPESMWTYVRAIRGDIVAANVHAPQVESTNAANQVDLEVTAEQAAGPENCISVTPDGSAYDGLADGATIETYTIMVLDSSISGDHTTARLRILSASGDDDQITVIPSAMGLPTTIGTRGLSVIFGDADTEACSQSAENEGVSSIDLLTGQQWTVQVKQSWTRPAISLGDGSSYAEENSTTYIIEVTKGGFWDASPEIRVTTTTGTDMSGPTIVADQTPVLCGTLGIFVEFDGDGLNLGDRYYVDVTGAQEGPMRILDLGHNLPVELPTDAPIGIDMYIRKPLLQISRNRTGFAPLVNFDTSQTEITTNQGILAYDETWTWQGNPLPLEVHSAEDQNWGVVFAEYRAWLPTLAFEVNGIWDVGELNNQISGPLDPDNPLKWGVFKALSNSNGTEVKYTAVTDPDNHNRWIDVLELLLGRDDVYGLVPLTRNRTALDLFSAHVHNMSSPEQGLWRVLWLSLEGVPELPVVHTGTDIGGHLEPSTSDGKLCLCTFEDDPLTSGLQYTRMRCTSNNGQFITNGVRPGDIVRALYVGDGFGTWTWTEFVIDQVQSENLIRLMTGPDAPQSIPRKIEIWRNLSATEEAYEIGRRSGSWYSRRVRAVWPDRIESGGTLQEGYHLCAALSGLSSGILPHQGMTNLEVRGFSDVPRTTRKFNRPQLDQMALGGVWIVTQELSPTAGDLGKIYTRHAMTTGNYVDINMREEMLTRNVDNISYRFKDHFAPYIGVTNVTPSMILRIRNETENLIRVLKTERFTVQLGGQLIEAEIVRLEQHLTIRDRLVMVLLLTVPYALNNFEIHLVVP